MYQIDRIKKKTINYMFDHPVQKAILKNSFMVLATALSAFIFVFGFESFVQPEIGAMVDGGTALVSSVPTLASAGASGLSQLILRIMELANWGWLSNSTNSNIMFWILYFAINVPLFVLAFFKIGKKFTIFTLLNVGFVSLFGAIIPRSLFINEIAKLVFEEPVARIVLAGICTGISSGIAYLIETSSGGVDIIAYYIAEKKSKQVGWFSALINAVIVICFCTVSTFHGGIVSAPGGSGIVANRWPIAFIMMLYTCLYMVVSSALVNLINIYNKKVNVQIITNNENLAQVVIANIPHGCTIFRGKGGYSGDDKFMIMVSVRKNECKRVVNICKKADPTCFINVFQLDQVYGKFFRKPIE